MSQILLNTDLRRESELSRSRDLYLDLLVKVVTNTIYQDPPLQPVGATFKHELREKGLDWPSLAHTMSGTERLNNVRELTQRVIDDGIRGDLAELGVWRGGCCILMRGVLAANGDTSRKVYVIDSFAGLPPPNPEEFPQDKTLTLHTYEDLAISVGRVKENFSRYGLLDDQVIFVEGLFQDTLTDLNAGPFALIRLDGDMYESTYVALEALYPRVSPGGYIIVDDYGFVPACRQAVTDYRTRMGIDGRIEKIDWAGAWWQKTN
ncbi:MAG: class I SAM-dependent methyltransferase [Chthoniobacterales bacterium]|nr:class I SAM-dependent methyltransferase [Chthoniobacterales bacterium]